MSNSRRELIKSVVKEIQSQESKNFQKALNPFLERAYMDAVYFMHRFSDKELLDYLFPDLEIEKISEYPFEKANIEIYVLSEDENTEFNKRLDYDLQSDAVAITSKKIDDYRKDGPPIIVACISKVKKEINVTDEERVVLEKMNIMEILVHEILHILGLDASNILLVIVEGFVELIAQSIVKKDPYFNQYPHLFKYAILGYPSYATGMTYLVNNLIKSGLKMEIIIKAYGMGDIECIKEIDGKMVEIYGKDIRDEILRIISQDPETFGKYMASIQSKIAKEIST